MEGITVAREKCVMTETNQSIQAPLEQQKKNILKNYENFTYTSRDS